MMNSRYTYIYALVLSVLMVVSCSDDYVADDGVQPSALEQPTVGVSEGEVLVKFSPELTPVLDNLASEGAFAVRTRSALPSVDRIYEILGSYQLKRVFPVDTENEDRTRAAGLHLWYQLTFNDSVDVSKAMAELSLLGEVQKVQANRITTYANRPKPVVVRDVTALAGTRSSADAFNDPMLYRQWGYINRGGQSFARAEAPSIAGCDLNCEEAWKLCTGDPSIIVAVLDEGVMYNHPDLAANMWVNDGEELHAGRDADGNGYKDDKYGYNFVTDCALINPYGRSNTGHGSHVAGTIAAVNNNGIGCSGIAGGDGSGNGVKIMSLQIIDGNNAVTLLNEAKAMKYAADNGAVVMQCSWGYNSALADQLMGYTPGPATEEEWAELYPLEKESIDYFIDNAGSPDGVIDGGIVVFASGNEFSPSPAFPGAYSRCVCVSSIAADYTPSTFSNYGAEVDFSAPGGDSDYYGVPGIDDDEWDISDPTVERGMIFSTLVSEDQPAYGYFEGTSMSCPAVSGVVALGLSYAKQLRKHFTVSQFVSLMRDTSRNLDQYYSGTKLYHYYHTMPGTTARTMDLATWRGKMGTLPDAGALLKRIEGVSSEMHVPNILVAKDKSKTLRLSDYFANGETLSYNVKVADATVASATLQGTLLTVRGIKPGITTATITAGSKTVTITITVRESDGYGWL